MELDGRLLAWVALSALLIATPGPDTALIIRNALASGPRASTMSAIGVAVGILAWAAAATFGVGVLLERSSTAFTILKLAGGAYLAYLGLRSLLSRAPADPDVPRATLGDRTAWGQGLFSNLLNPKTGAFFVTVMPQFPHGRGLRGDAARLADRLRTRCQQVGPQRAGLTRPAFHDPAHRGRLDRAWRPACFRAPVTPSGVRFRIVLVNALGVLA